jgi:hypothetical protein
MVALVRMGQASLAMKMRIKTIAATAEKARMWMAISVSR